MPDEPDLFIEGVVHLINNLKPGERLVISRVPLGDDLFDDHMIMEPIPRQVLRKLIAILKAKHNGN